MAKTRQGVGFDAQIDETGIKTFPTDNGAFKPLTEEEQKEYAEEQERHQAEWVKRDQERRERMQAETLEMAAKVAKMFSELMQDVNDNQTENKIYLSTIEHYRKVQQTELKTIQPLKPEYIQMAIEETSLVIKMLRDTK